MSVVAANSLGGKLIAISGPCFEQKSIVTCQFGDVSTEGTITSSLRAYCVSPILNEYGIITFTVLVENDLELEEYTTPFTLCKTCMCYNL